jgi:hypothetical protein
MEFNADGLRVGSSGAVVSGQTTSAIRSQISDNDDDHVSLSRLQCSFMGVMFIECHSIGELREFHGKNIPKSASADCSALNRGNGRFECD